MKKIAHILFLRLTILLVAMSTVVACHSHKEDEPSTSLWEGRLYLDLNVDVLESGRSGRISASRANETYYELPVLDSEKLHTLRVIILKADNKEVVHNEFRSMYFPGSGMGGLRYEVEFSTDYLIYLFGNESGLPDDVQAVLQNIEEGKSYSVNPLDNLLFESEATGVLINNTGEEKTLIPMTEKFAITTIPRPQTIAEYSIVTMEQKLFVTRAATKFTFNFYKSEDWDTLDPDETKLLEVKGIKISGLGRNEFVIPVGTEYDPPKGTVSNQEYGGRLITDFNLPDGSTSNDDYIFGVNPFRVSQLNVADKGKPHTFAPELYFPESKGLAITPTEDNPNPVGGQFTCALSYDGETYTEPVGLPNLSDLPRNTHVVVNITIAPQTVRIKVEVEPYTVVELDPIFGLTDPNDKKDPETPGDETGGETGGESGDETK